MGKRSPRQIRQQGGRPVIALSYRGGHWNVPWSIEVHPTLVFGGIFGGMLVLLHQEKPVTTGIVTFYSIAGERLKFRVTALAHLSRN